MTSFTFKENQAEVSALTRALYVHVPFCRVKCRYCDFYSLTFSSELAANYISSVLQELELNRHWLARPLDSIFLGGGTPTALPAGQLARLLEGLACWSDENTEFSVEANPGTVGGEVVEVLRDSGVNRVSLGAQSFDEGQLEMLGRIHRPGDIAQAVDAIRGAGIENISLDLMYGLPGQSVASWEKSLDEAAKIQPKHLSCYALSFEQGTALDADLQAGRLEEVDDDTQREMYYLTAEKMLAVGLEHYEISNFALPEFRCRHNLTYWHNEPYLGLGPAAASYLGGLRRTNSPDMQAYLQSLAGPEPKSPPADSERIVGRLAMAETLMLGLRLIDGVDLAEFEARFGCRPDVAFPKSIKRYIELGALELTQSCLRLRRKALFTADTVLADIIAEAEE